MENNNSNKIVYSSSFPNNIPFVSKEDNVYVEIKDDDGNIVAIYK